MLPDFSLKRLFGRLTKYAVATAVIGPALLGIAQCSHQNDYDAWDERALMSYLDNTGANYYWEYRQARNATAFVGAKVPDARCQP